VKKKIAFICLGNSCRSIMAEALTRHLYGAAWDAASAGLNPLGYVTWETLQVLAEMGVATEGLRSKGLGEINLEECDLVVNLADRRLGAVLAAACKGMLLHRPMPDPYGGSLEVYRQARDRIKGLITGELSEWLAPSGQTDPRE
jgi:protein-tyrosine-phosphatase